MTEKLSSQLPSILKDRGLSFQISSLATEQETTFSKREGYGGL